MSDVWIPVAPVDLTRERHESNVHVFSLVSQNLLKGMVVDSGNREEFLLADLSDSGQYGFPDLGSNECFEIRLAHGDSALELIEFYDAFMGQKV